MTGMARAVASEIRRRIPGVGQMKLQKLLYYAQGHHLADTGEVLFPDTISAWDNGPVVTSLWHEKREGRADDPAIEPVPLDEAALNTIGYVLSRYGGMTGRDLIALSHGEPPWMEANATRKPGTSVKIPVERIRAYFESTPDDDDESGLMIDGEALAMMLAGAEERLRLPAEVDSVEGLERLRATLIG